MQVDRARVHRLEGASAVDGADQPAAVLGDAVLLGSAGAQADAGSGRTATRPHGAAITQHEAVPENELSHAFAQVLTPPLLVVE